MPNALILLIGCSSLVAFSYAVCPAGACTSSLESSAQSSALLQQSAVRATPNVGWNYRSHMNSAWQRKGWQVKGRQEAINFENSFDEHSALTSKDGVIKAQAAAVVANQKRAQEIEEAAARAKAEEAKKNAESEKLEAEAAATAAAKAEEAKKKAEREKLVAEAAAATAAKAEEAKKKAEKAKLEAEAAAAAAAKAEEANKKAESEKLVAEAAAATAAKAEEAKKKAEKAKLEAELAAAAAKKAEEKAKSEQLEVEAAAAAASKAEEAKKKVENKGNETGDLEEAGDPHIRDALVDRKHNLIMGWSARSACTATVNMFFENAGIYHAGEKANFPWVHDYREARGHAIQPKASEMKSPNFLKFKIVRNPYRRAVSNWVHQMETNFSYNEVYQDLAAKNSVNQSSNFLQWLRFVKKVGYDKLDDHSKPQFSDWEKAGGKYDVILQLESSDFDRRLSEINHKSNSALKFETMHVSSFLATAAHRSKFPRDEVGRLIHPPTEELYKNAESVKLAQEIYAKDFEAYGYSKADVPVA